MDETGGATGEVTRRMQRLEELRQELGQTSATRRAYALQALLSLLWVEEGWMRHTVAGVLCGHAPQIGKGEVPLCALRICDRLEGQGEILAPPPPHKELILWAGKAVAGTLQTSIDTLKAITYASDPNKPVLRREAEVCRDALSLAQRLGTAEMAEPCLRLLRVLPSELAQETGAFARETSALREAACLALGALPPHALSTLWLHLGGSDPVLRRNLMQTLDYITDARAVPHLTHLLEQRSQSEEGLQIGWSIVRAFQRIGDRSALPALRRIAAGGSSLLLMPWRRSAKLAHTSPELAQLARQVILEIETRRESRDRQTLLRASSPTGGQLLRPSLEPASTADGEELLRAHEGTKTPPP